MKCFTEIHGVSIVLQLTMQVLHWKYEAVYVFLVLTMHFFSSLTAHSYYFKTFIYDLGAPYDQTTSYIE